MPQIIVDFIPTGAPAQLATEKYVADAISLESHLQWFLVKLRRIFRVRIRASVRHHLNRVRLQQIEKMLDLMIRVSDREYAQTRIGDVFHSRAMLAAPSLAQGREAGSDGLEAVCYAPVRPMGCRRAARSRFSRRFINVRKVLRTRAFISSARCKPLVDARASISPWSAIKRMISTWRACGVLPYTVSRRISAHAFSICSVKWSRQRCAGSSEFGTCPLHPCSPHAVSVGIFRYSQVINCSHRLR